jgi:hypothetical protein
LQILRSAIARTSKSQTLAEEVELQDLRNRLDFLLAKAACERVDDKVVKEIQTTRQVLSHAKEAVKAKRVKFRQLQLKQECLVSVKCKLNHLAVKIHNLQSGMLLRDGVSFLLLRRLAGWMEHEIRKEAKAIGVHVVIDRAVVDAAIKDEISNL